MIALSQHAAEMLLTARRSDPGALVFTCDPPAAMRELQDNGLINSKYKLTRRGARERAERVTATSEGGTNHG